MALRQAKIQPTLQEKRYITLQFLEAAYVSGNRVIITPVDTYDLSTLSAESFTYKDPIETYIIYDERPRIGLLKKFGWFREDQENLPQIAFIPTHLLYERFVWNDGEYINTTEPTSPEEGDLWFDETEDKLYAYTSGARHFVKSIPTEEPETLDSLGMEWFDEEEDKLYTTMPGPVVNEVLLNGQEMKDLVETGVSDRYELRPLEIKRGTLVDVFFDFAPAQELPEPDGPYDFAMDNSGVINRFYVTEPRIDTVSINYTCKLMAYKYDAEKESDEDQNPSNGEFLKFNSDDFGV